MTTRRQVLVAGVSALAPAFAFGQPRPVRVGILGPRAKSFFAPHVVRRLGELGYREGPGVILENRSSEGVRERYPALAQELVGLKCDLIFAIGDEFAARSLRGAGVPVVFLAVDYDPAERGLVQSLARPGGNMTGVYSLDPMLILKRMEIAQDIVPGVNRLLVVSDPYSRHQAEIMREQSGARSISVVLHEFSALPYSYPDAFDAARKVGARAIVVLTSPALADGRGAIAALSLQRKIPVIGFATPEVSFVAGISANPKKLAERAAEIGVRVLKGAKPAEMPVELAGDIDFEINLQAAKALGVTIPYSLLARATRVLE